MARVGAIHEPPKAKGPYPMTETIELTAQEMQVIMMALYSTEEMSDEASELHDKLTGDFDRFEPKRSAKLVFRVD